MIDKLQIHQDIRQASTLPAAFYRSLSTFDESKEKIFSRTWHYIVDKKQVAHENHLFPFTFLKKILNEPLLFSCNANKEINCLSNVCTHRGKVLVENPKTARMISCGYHGRCFRLDGSFKSMPEFELIDNFPTQADHLTKIPFAEWAKMLFVSLNPAFEFSEWLKPIQERLSWLPFDTLQFDKESSKDYHVNCHWALYCDNYLEGFHIPFVHPALNEALDFGNYEYHLYPYCNLQIGVAKENESCFDIPEGAPDYGKRIYAYYYWLFPNLMLNFYPWGLSMNIVEPLSNELTIVQFRTYFFKNTIIDRSLFQIDKTELEDEAVVESVQKGIQSRYYQSGRFSPTMEQGVHHFHQLIASFMG